MGDSPQPELHTRVVDDTRRWVERAVIGLNLCPFAKAVHVKRQIRYAVSAADSAKQALDDLDAELDRLAAADPGVHETTLLILPSGFDEFIEFTDLLRRCDKRIRRCGLDGVIQLASFHPEYRFADAEPGDTANFSNRSPYPTLHLLREDSIARAVQTYPQPESIYEANIRRLRELGARGWSALGVERT